MRSIRIDDESRIAEVRRLASNFAKTIGFDDTDAGRCALVATELTSNLWKHAKEGEALVSLYDDGDGAGVEILALDRGPGMADVSAAMRDGHSTTGTPGTGLGAVNRVADVLEIYAPPRKGVVALARISKRKPSFGGKIAIARSGAVSLPKAGETACGDAWSVKRAANGDLWTIVVDGLGHGPMAAAASHEAIKVFQASNGKPSAELLAAIHLALRHTRGAAASLAELLIDDQHVSFIGVGNVAGVIATDEETRRMVSFNGTLGHAIKTVRPFVYETQGQTLVVLASDGLGTSWSFEDYPGLKSRHPSIIAAVLYRDFSRGRDDVTVLVSKRAAA